MEDSRIWEFEKSLWTGDAEHYRELIDDNCVMVLPAEPFAMSGAQAIETVAATPRWSDVDFSQMSVVRPEQGLIVIAYHAEASNESGESYKAWCPTTMRRLAHDEWRVVQHSQTIAPVVADA
jgi:hypothetical protein